jgi:hypothetical protein
MITKGKISVGFQIFPPCLCGFFIVILSMQIFGGPAKMWAQWLFEHFLMYLHYCLIFAEKVSNILWAVYKGSLISFEYCRDKG